MDYNKRKSQRQICLPLRFQKHIDLQTEYSSEDYYIGFLVICMKNYVAMACLYATRNYLLSLYAAIRFATLSLMLLKKSA